MKDNGNGIVFTDDGIPPCLIKVDKEGRMWHLGAEMIHDGINQLLRQHVELDDQGRYIIEYRGQRCYVEVEDTFFVINRVDRPNGENGEVKITLNDGSEENLNAGSITAGTDNVLYAQVKNGRFPARFLRKSYYQLAEWIVEEEGRFLLKVNGQYHIIG